MNFQLSKKISGVSTVTENFVQSGTTVLIISNQGRQLRFSGTLKQYTQFFKFNDRISLSCLYSSALHLQFKKTTAFWEFSLHYSVSVFGFNLFQRLRALLTYVILIFCNGLVSEMPHVCSAFFFFFFTKNMPLKNNNIFLYTDTVTSECDSDTVTDGCY